MRLSLEEALKEQENQVDGLIKSANKYVGALKAWKKACQVGHIGNLQKASAQAEDLVGGLSAPNAEVKSAWNFDVRDYLENADWRKDIQDVAQAKFGLRVLEDNETLVSSPVVIRSQPGSNRLVLGKVAWPTIQPAVVAAELKRLRDRAAGANSQEFLEGLFAAAQLLSKDANSKVENPKPFASFKDIYALFALTPGWKKENPPAAFGQAIYALQRSEIRMTRAGRKYEIEYQTGNVKDKDLFIVIAEDGRSLRYWGIQFL
jgi:hypothetical protein